MLRRLSVFLLLRAERFFLRMHGWRSEKDCGWMPPDGYPGPVKKRIQGHAVNSQKFYFFHSRRG